MERSDEVMKKDILCADIGGTNTRMAIVRPLLDGGFDTVRSTKLRSADFDSLESAITHFLRIEGEECRRAAFGIAGPVVDGRCELTNRPWKVVDSAEIAKALGFEGVILLNDLEALAWGIPLLGETRVETLHAGEPLPGNRALSAAGTGFGQAGIYWNGNDYRPFATEGGHTNFGPRNELDVELLRFLWTRYPRVSWERAVSGMGLANVFDFHVSRSDSASRQLLEEIAAIRTSEGFRPGEEAASISTAAMEERCEVASQALDHWVALYASETGNLALKTQSLAGVYLGGGIPPRVLERLRSPIFREAFVEKGRMRGMLERMPLHVILDDSHTAIYGAALALLVESGEVESSLSFGAASLASHAP